MKKIISLALLLTLLLSLFVGCSAKTDDKKIVVGASPTPHAQILEVIKDELKAKGYDLEIVEYADYVQPNVALSAGDLDANYFQHKPYLDLYNKENKKDLVSAGAIHYEPFGVYPGKLSSLSEIKEGSTISVPNDGSNEARALLLLESAGLIKVSKEAGFNATILDITENPKNLKIVEIEAAQLVRSLEDVDFAAINGNYALQGGLSAAGDALVKEEVDSLSATTYANIIAVQKGKENTPKIKALLEALKSDTVKNFLNETFPGAVVPTF